MFESIMFNAKFLPTFLSFFRNQNNWENYLLKNIKEIKVEHSREKIDFGNFTSTFAYII